MRIGLVAILLTRLCHQTALAEACPALNFTAPATFRTGTNPASVAVGDFNGDGKADLAVANSAISGGTASVSVLLGRGDGTFQTAVNYGTGSGSASVAMGDFNHDGVPDLSVANAGSTNVSVLLGQGGGLFQAAVNYRAGDQPSQFVAVGDFDRNGQADLAMANRVSAKVSVILGRGDGTFLSAVAYDVGTDPLSVVVGDFNGDLNPDLAVANSALFDNLPSISVLLGNGNGTFRAAVNYNAGTSPRSLAVGDFNGDGKLDIAVANYGSFGTNGQLTNSAVSVLIGKGDGTFAAAVKYNAGEGPLALAVEDFNGDDKLDLAVANNRSRNVSLLLGKGDGTFDTPVNFAAGVNPLALAAGDFNGDGQPDLAVVNDGVSVLLNTCASTGVDLSIVLSTTTFTISWPLPSTTFVLESTTGLSPANWLPAETPLTNNGRLEVTVPLGQGNRYFRLHQQ